MIHGILTATAYMNINNITIGGVNNPKIQKGRMARK
jgi:hypothetical protein